MNGFIEAVWVFFGLYFWSLFSVSPLEAIRCDVDTNSIQLDPYKSAESSPFNVKNPPAKLQAGQAPGQRPTTRPAFKTMSDLGS